VRENIGGELMSLVYGNPCAVHLDPVEKKPLFHFLPGTSIFSIATAGCNLHCKVCQNWEISQRGPEETRNTDLPPERVASAAKENGCRSIAYTYNDPVVFYEYAYDSSAAARRLGLKNVLVTAGYINEEPLRRICPLIDAANVDLKGDDAFYRAYCSGTAAPVQRALEVMAKLGVWLEITNLIVPTLNDSDDRITWLVRWIAANLGPDVPLHFSRFHPMYKLSNLPPTPAETLIRARRIALAEGLRYVYIGNVSGIEGQATVCPSCGTEAVVRNGFRVLKNTVRNGTCSACGAPLPGVWE